MDWVCGSADLAALSRAVLGAGRCLRFRARGQSMTPLVRDGDLLLVEPARQARVGDVVLCCPRPGWVVVHRVVGRAGTPALREYVVQGDCAPEPDGVIGRGDLLGRVVALERSGAVVPLDGVVARLLGWLMVLRRHCPGAPRVAVALGRRVAMSVPALSQYLA